MAGVLAAFFSSVLAVAAYGLYFTFCKAQKFESAIRKLQKHARVMFYCWILGFPLFILLFRGFSSTPAGILNLSGAASQAALLICGITVLLSLLFLYTAVYFLVDRSISSRMMIEIENSVKKALTFEELKEVYGVEAKYRDEIEGMAHAGFLVKKEGRFKCSPAAGMISAAGALIKGLLKLGPGG
jgi:hypothetical protein